MDLIGRFISEVCVEGEAASVPAAALYFRFGAWSERQGIRWPMTKNLFGRRLTERGFRKDRVGRDKVHTWFGLGLRDEGNPALRVLRSADDRRK